MWDEIIYPFPSLNGFVPLKFGNGYVISSHTALGMWLLVHAGIRINPFLVKGPLELCPFHTKSVDLC